MSAVTFADANPVLATLFNDRIANQINRCVVLGQLLDVRPGQGKNLSWVNRFGTATVSGAVISDGADVSTYNNDTRVASVLQYGTYHDAFAVTGKAMAAARAAGNPMQMAALLVEELSNSAERLARVIGSDIYVGSGATDYIHGLFASGIPAIGDVGSYTGVSRVTYAQWKGTVIDAGSAPMSFDFLRELRRKIFIASGLKPDIFVCDPVQHERIGALHQAQRRYVQEVRRNDGMIIKLDGGYQILEFDGILVVEDPLCPAGTFIALNSQFTYLSQLGDAPDMVARALGMLQLGGTPEEQFGSKKMGLTARINPLAVTGDALKYQLICYPQLACERPNTCGYITNLAQ